MTTTRWLGCGALACLLTLPLGVRGGDEIPPDAQKLIEELDQETKAIQEKADKEIKTRKDKVIERLKQLQDTYCRALKIDEAIAIRDKIRLIKAAAVDFKPDPVRLSGYSDQIGKSFVFEVTGSTTGFIWGTGVYTSDSILAMAAVHAGVLKEGQKGYVKVTMLKGEDSYIGSTNNGVTSMAYRAYPSSYRIDPVE
jgi:hypothetical protein